MVTLAIGVNGRHRLPAQTELENVEHDSGDGSDTSPGSRPRVSLLPIIKTDKSNPYHDKLTLTILNHTLERAQNRATLIPPTVTDVF